MQVMRKRNSTDAALDHDCIYPLKRSKSSLQNLPSTSIAESSMAEVISLAKQLSRTFQQGLKRKQEDAIDAPPSKRHRTSSNDQSFHDVNEAAGTSSTDTTLVTVNNIMDIEMSTDAIVPTPELANSDHKTDSTAIAEIATEEAAMITDANVEGAQANVEQPAVANATSLADDLELICDIHQTVDPIYIEDLLKANIDDPQRISTVTFAIYEAVADDIPTREDREALEEAREALEEADCKREQLRSLVFDVHEFIKRYPDPVVRFDVKDTEVTELYYDHAEVFLKKEYRQMNIAYIKKVLQRNGFHLTPAYYELKQDQEIYNRKNSRKGSKIKYRKSLRSEAYEYPDEPEEEFYWERLFLDNQVQIFNYIEADKQAKIERFEKAKLAGNLYSCSICLSEDIFGEDMGSCSSSNHHFCLSCIKRSTEEILGQGRSSFPCLDINCGCEFTLQMLPKALSEHTMSLVIRRVQAEQLKQANLEHLVACPFCQYAVIIPEGHTSSVFHCENPECMQDSCRNCQKQAHIPYTCDEFKNLREVTYAHFVENQMAEAIIRQCPKCNQRFIKEEGCNMMNCQNCNINICYICKVQVKNVYNHFQNNNCQSFTNMTELHEQEAMEAFKAAADNFKVEHPMLRRVNLSFQNPFEAPALCTGI